MLTHYEKALVKLSLHAPKAPENWIAAKREKLEALEPALDRVTNFYSSPSTSLALIAANKASVKAHGKYLQSINAQDRNAARARIERALDQAVDHEWPLQWARERLELAQTEPNYQGF